MTELDFPQDISKVDLIRMKKLLELRDARVRFAKDYHRNTRGEPLQFDLYPYLRELYNSLSPTLILQGSVQCRKTELILIDHFAASYIGLSVFFVIPKVESRNTFVKNRIDRCVEKVPFYKDLIKGSFFDSVALKNFGKGVIKYVGSNAISDFKEFPADLLCIDELNECDQENIKYAPDRLEASPYKFKRFVANPTYEGRGISALYDQSTAKKWYLPCRKCGMYQEVDWFNCIVSEINDRDGNVIGYDLLDDTWKIGCGRDITMVCRGCGGSLIRESTEGQWKAKNPEHLADGYQISKLHDPTKSISEMWMNFQPAIHDPLKMKHFCNSELGIPYKGIGTNITESTLDTCVDENYEFVVDLNKGYAPNFGDFAGASMGMDIGGNKDVKISVNENGKRRMIFYGKIKSIDEVHDLVSKYGVQVCVVDAGPEGDMVKQFQQEATCDVWLCRYHKTEGEAMKTRHDYVDRIITIDRTYIMDKAYSNIKAKRLILPRNYRNIVSGRFSKEMCGPRRELEEDARGNPRYVWHKCEDHARHADVYDLLADEILQGATISEVFVA